uniref:Uncharacterized protein n=1 Tax=Rhizophora mucronata TaxID=61149 RepID=A0A2P2K4Y0_RHIMU
MWKALGCDHRKGKNGFCLENRLCELKRWNVLVEISASSEARPCSHYKSLLDTSYYLFIFLI